MSTSQLICALFKTTHENDSAETVQVHTVIFRAHTVKVSNATKPKTESICPLVLYIPLGLPWYVHRVCAQCAGVSCMLRWYKHR